jgi:hypothetical protein
MRATRAILKAVEWEAIPLNTQQSLAKLGPAGVRPTDEPLRDLPLVS